MTTTSASIRPGPVQDGRVDPIGPTPSPFFATTTPALTPLEQSLEPQAARGPLPLAPEVRPRRKRRGLVFASMGCLLLLTVGGTAGAVGVWFALGQPLPDGLPGLAEYVPGLEALGPISGPSTDAAGFEVIGLGEEAIILDADDSGDATESAGAGDPAPTASNRVPLEHVPAVVSGVGDSLIVRATTWGRETCTVLLKLRPVHQDWQVHTLARNGQNHSLELPVSSEMSPAFEYTILATGCGTARWPADCGMHRVWLD